MDEETEIEELKRDVTRVGLRLVRRGIECVRINRLQEGERLTKAVRCLRSWLCEVGDRPEPWL